MTKDQVLDEVEQIIPGMTRKDAMLTPEEARLYEQYSIIQVQAMAQAEPAVSSIDDTPVLSLSEKIALLKDNWYELEITDSVVAVFDAGSYLDDRFYRYLNIGTQAVETVLEKLVDSALKELSLI